MLRAKSNCDLGKKVPASFPYVQVLILGRPVPGTGFSAEKHPPMDRTHRAKIFSSFDALDGFSELIREKDRLREEAVPEKAESNICTVWEDP